MEFGEILREHRLRSGWTQEELAERSGVSIHAISVLESGKRRPRLSSVAHLATALGLDSAARDELIMSARRTTKSGSAPSAEESTPEPAPAPTEPRPRNDLPRVVGDFTGRQEELARLVAERAEGAPTALVISAIDGMAGVGKTALAVHAAHLLVPRYPDGQLFLDLYGHTPGHDPVDTSDALHKLLSALGVSDERIPGPVDERSALWRAELASRSVLVVLDNAADADQVSPLLPGASECMVLITSRRRLVDLEGAASLSLDVLPPDEAVALFTAIAGPDATAGHAEAVAEAVRLCGYLPLAIRIAAARLRHRPAWNPSHLVERLREQLSAAGSGVGDGQVAAAFEVSYRRLGPDRQRMFRLLSLHPGRDIDAHAAAALTGTTLRQAEALLEDLVDDHLIQQPGLGRYTYHDLLRDHARRIVAAEEDERVRRAALTSLFEFYRFTVLASMTLVAPHEKHLWPAIDRPAAEVPEFAEAKPATRWLDTERANLLAVAGHTSHGDWPAAYASDLSTMMFRYLDIHAHPADAMVLHTHAVNATGDDPARQGNALRHLGTVHGRSGHYGPAIECLERAIVLHHEVADHAGEAGALSNLGIVLWHLGRNDEAISLLAQALVLHQMVGDRQAEARIASNLGGLYWFLGHGDQAMEHLQQALAVFRELGIKASETYTLNTLGIISAQSGRYGQAVAHFRLVMTLSRETGDRRAEVAAFHGLGAMNSRLGRHEQALDDLLESLTLAREVGDVVGEGDALSLLGVAFRQSGHPEHAADHPRQALALFQSIGHRSGEAEALISLGDAVRFLGRREEALDHLGRALILSRDLGIRNTETMALNSLGDTATEFGDAEQAVVHHTEALGLVGDSVDPYHEARAHDGLARAHESLGHRADAEAHRAKALALYTELGVPEADGAAHGVVPTRG